MPFIALDAMGGDQGSKVLVEGARLANQNGVKVILVGDPEKLDSKEFSVIAAKEVVGMDEDPGKSVRAKKDSSIARATEAVRDKKAEAVVSAGNTGAVMAAALLKLGRIKGVARPAIAVPFPVLNRSHPNLLLDCGANAECQPEWLAQFARMGVVHIRDRYKIKRPRVGLISIGEEASKGSSLVKNTHELLDAKAWQKDLDCEFIGNLEGRDILSDVAEVFVTDGFTGNVILKTVEGIASTLTSGITGALSKLDSEITDPVYESLMPLYEAWNPSKTGGAVLLGVKGVCVIAHGSSNESAILNALLLAEELVQKDTIKHLTEAITVN